MTQQMKCGNGLIPMDFTGLTSDPVTEKKVIGASVESMSSKEGVLSYRTQHMFECCSPHSPNTWVWVSRNARRSSHYCT